jgi:hypothetical protein
VAPGQSCQLLRTWHIGRTARTTLVPPKTERSIFRTLREDRRWFEWEQKGAPAAGTPFATVFSPSEILALAREAGFNDAQHVSLATLAQRYFADRTDGLRPSSGEDFLVGTT